MSEGNQADMLAALAIELQNPLVKIANEASLAGKPTDDSRFVQKTAEEMLRVIDTMLLATRLNHGTQKPEIESFDVRTAIRNIRIELQALVKEHKQEFVLKTKRYLPAVTGDKRVVEAILKNLLTHASLAAPQQTKITLSIRKQQNELQILIRNQGQQLDIGTVQRLNQIGSLRQPLPQEAYNSGLGLYVAMRLAEAVSARIEYIPSREGSCFALHLPTNQQMKLF